MKILSGIGFVLLITLILLLISGLVVDFHYFNKLYNAKSPEEIKAICQSDWYQNSDIKNLPVKCSTIKLY